MGHVLAQSIPSKGYKDFSVSFNHTFKNKPEVIVSLLGGSQNTAYLGISVMDSTLTTSSVTVRVTNNGSAAYSIGLTWIAIES